MDNFNHHNTLMTYLLQNCIILEVATYTLQVSLTNWWIAPLAVREREILQILPYWPKNSLRFKCCRTSYKFFKQWGEIKKLNIYREQEKQKVQEVLTSTSARLRGSPITYAILRWITLTTERSFLPSLVFDFPFGSLCFRFALASTLQKTSDYRKPLKSICFVIRYV